MMIKENIFDGAPNGGDPRQEESLGCILKVIQKLKSDSADKVGAISMEGFPAAAVNLGWLQDRIRETWESRKITETEVLRVHVKMDLPEVIQRLKRLRVDLCYPKGKGSVADRRHQDLEVNIVTKDDFGWYEYNFYVRLWLDDA